MRACLRSSCAAICSGLNSKGTSLRVRLIRAAARLVKFWMKMRQTPIVPKKALTSVRVQHGPHLLTASIHVGSAMRPSMLQRCPKTIISGTQRNNLGPENVPPQYFMHWTTLLRFSKCSQMNCRMAAFSGIVS
jgi:hypothetical protein